MPATTSPSLGEKAHARKPELRDPEIAIGYHSAVQFTQQEFPADRHRAIVLLADGRALRFGELAELRRADVDLENAVIRVRRGVVPLALGWGRRQATQERGRDP